MRAAILAVVCTAVAASGCGDDSGGSTTTPSPTTSTVAVTVNSPLRVGESVQATGTATMSNGQSQSVTTGWQSDIPTVARVTDAGMVTGIANGRANIYVVSGGKQGTSNIRVVPDYLGKWGGRVLVNGCTQSGAWADVKFCQEIPIGASDPFGLSVSQTGESINARPNYGDLVFQSVGSTIQPDGAVSFVTTYYATDVPISIEASWTMNGPRSGELIGTVNEIWRYAGLAGEGRLTQDIVGAVRTSTTPLVAVDGEASSKALILPQVFRR